MPPSFARPALSLGLCYTLGTFNDNFFKQAVLLLAVSMGSAGLQSWGTVLFSLPFVLFSAWSGWLADRFPKRDMVLAAKLLELLAMLAGAWGLLTLNWFGLLTMLFCMGVSATLFSPALNGSLPEIFPPDRVPRANALLRLFTTASILLGMVLAGAALERQWLDTAIPFGRWLVAVTVVAVAALGLAAVALIPRRPAAARPEDLPPFPLTGAWRSACELRRLRQRRTLFACLCADAYFYGLSVLILLRINAYGLTRLGMTKTVTSLLPGGLMLGICLGALLAARQRHQDWRQGVPRAATGMGLLLMLAACAPLLPAAAHLPFLLICYAVAGICGSLYIIPVSSHLQLLPAPDEKGRILGTSNFFSFSAMLLAGAVDAPLSLLPPEIGHALLGGLTLVLSRFFAGHAARLPATDAVAPASPPAPLPGRLASLPRRLLAGMARTLLSLRYRVRLTGQDELRAAVDEARARGRGILLLPNHPSFMDPAILCAWLAPLAPRPLADRHQIDRFWLRPLTALLRAIPLPDLRRDGSAARKEVETALDACATALRRGENILLFPAGSLSRDGRTRLGGNSGVHRLLRAVPDCQPVIVRLQGLWGSSFSRADGSADLGRALRRGFLALLRHGFVFLPRREVRLDFVRPTDLPPVEAGVAALNARLEAIYAEDGDILRRTPLSRRQPARADLPLAAAGVLPAPGGDMPSDAARRKVVHALLAEASPLHPAPESLLPEQRLDSDLGLDSLALVELALQLENVFGHPQPALDSLQTVRDCLLAASGLLEPAPLPETGERDWLAARRTRPARPLRLPDGPHLPGIILRQLRRAPFRPLLADGERILTAGGFWLRAVLLSRFLRRRAGTGQHIGILLPASSAAALSWLAVLLSGNTPVMGNWTTGAHNLRHGLELTGVRHVISARALLCRLGEERLREALAGAGADWLLLEDVAELPLRARLSGFCRAALSLLGFAACALPERLSPTAAILFTSGSSAAPKAVPLRHENILANCRDVAAVLELDSHDAMLAMLPPFHSLGLTGNIALPLCFGLPVVYHANPTEGARLAALCRRRRPSLLVTPPTFLDGILRQARPGDLASLRLGFVGAEACPRRLYDEFARQTDGGLLCEGYGVTECAPVVSVNLPRDARPGTIGRALPSVQTRIVSPHAPELTLPAGECGLLLVSGPNVFDGYLTPEGETPPSPFLFLDGRRWYVTGDLVRADATGHMTFAGRQERFVKLGGEMISLPQIEAALLRRFAADQTAEGPALAVDALTTPGDGTTRPQLTLFTSLPLSLEQANAALRDEGFSGLCLLRRICHLPELPLLGSGKIDYGRLRREDERADA